MIEVQGEYKCAKHNMGVMVTFPRPGQTEEELITEAHLAAESTQRGCNQDSFRSCPINCQIRELIEKTKGIAAPHQH